MSDPDKYGDPAHWASDRSRVQVAPFSLTSGRRAQGGSGGRAAARPPRVQSTNRCLAFRQPRGRVVLQSRQQRSLTRYFPEVVVALHEQLSGGVVLDGEFLVCCGGRLDFAALQHRLHGRRSGKCPAGQAPACLVIFDILALSLENLCGPPYTQRRDLVAPQRGKWLHELIGQLERRFFPEQDSGSA
jgi:hypothetical protein